MEGTAEFIGRYFSPELAVEYDVVFDDGGLAVALPRQAGRRLFPELVQVAPGRFVDAEGVSLTFNRSSGGIEGFHLAGLGLQPIPFTRRD